MATSRSQPGMVRTRTAGSSRDVPHLLDGGVQHGVAADPHGSSRVGSADLRSSNSSDGEIGIAVIGIRSASSMAEAKTAEPTGSRRPRRPP